MFSKNLTDNMVFLGIEKIYSESTTKDLSDNIKVFHSYVMSRTPYGIRTSLLSKHPSADLISLTN